MGAVAAIDEDGDVIIQYPSGTRWTFNPIALKKVVLSPTSSPRSHSPQRTSVGSLTLSGLLDHFLTGDVVRVSSDREYVMKQQRGHGDWVDSMAIVSGCGLIVLLASYLFLFKELKEMKGGREGERGRDCR